MIFEAKISTVVVDKNGNDKVQKRAYIFENADSFSSVECTLNGEFGAETGFDVCAIKISRLKEIVNSRQTESDKIYFATIIDSFYDEDKDETVDTKYTVALFAQDINKAHQMAKDYMNQGLEDMELVGLKCTKFTDVIR